MSSSQQQMTRSSRYQNPSPVLAGSKNRAGMYFRFNRQGCMYATDPDCGERLPPAAGADRLGRAPACPRSGPRSRLQPAATAKPPQYGHRASCGSPIILPKRLSRPIRPIAGPSGAPWTLRSPSPGTKLECHSESAGWMLRVLSEGQVGARHERATQGRISVTASRAAIRPVEWPYPAAECRWPDQ
jgi:hypothetical protein